MKALNQNTSSFLRSIVEETKQAVAEGFYDNTDAVEHTPISLRQALLNCKKTPIIAEVKYASPSLGQIRSTGKVRELAQQMARGGASALSILTQQKHFNGSMANLLEARMSVKIPLLMKDFLVDPVQIKAARRTGADAVLLIHEIYDEEMVEYLLDEMIKDAHKLGLEVLLETNTLECFSQSMKTDADLIGINNRDLKTLKMDLNTTTHILNNFNGVSKPVISESGFQTPNQVKQFKQLGVKGFLIGSSIMASGNIEAQVRGLVEA
ncbi:MAG: indole-3-glycerol-phosphate synthase [Thaumarchaeota archaeon]|nr:indole-3-glycerol-phosphate synthase [Nitrososphaerota archaeon]